MRRKKCNDHINDHINDNINHNRMIQARRKSPAAKSKPRKSFKSGGHLASIVLLLAGMAIGSLATILWQGAQTADGRIGAGIRSFFDDTHQPTSGADENNAEAKTTQPVRPSTPFDFFTVLPGIEVVLPSTEPDIADAAKKQPEPKPATGTEGSAYMLQAASYRRHAEADRLKATFALNGIVSVIQKVSIQGRGDFYRVRLGPYLSFAAMEKIEQQLSDVGIKALRLKVSRAP